MTREEITEAYGVELNAVERFRKLGLIAPKRTEDGALVYSDTDGEMLRRLWLLEEMGFSENDFSQLKSGEKTLESLIRRQYSRLEEDCLGREICNQILAEGANLENFDAKKFLDQMGSHAPEGIFSFNTSFRNQVYHPWRRFFARTSDACIYGFIWNLFLAYVCHVNILVEGLLLDVVGTVVILAMVLLTEPLLLGRFGTTLGKWIFGLRIEKADGTLLSYAEGLRRTWGVIGKGEGYYIPIYNLVRLYKSYKLCKAEEVQPWDEDLVYTIKDTKWYRGVGFITLSLIYIFIHTVLVLGQLLPPNRGDITLEQFAENYNYFCKYIDANEGWYMNEKGQMVEQNVELSSFESAIELLEGGRPNFKYEIEDGYLKGVSFVYEVENQEHYTQVESEEQMLIAYAFGCTDEEVGLLWDAEYILDRMQLDDDFDFNFGNTRYFCLVEQEGYEGNEDDSVLFPSEYAERAYYKMTFSVTKED
ncbi:RDD family protein [Anaerotignum sp. MB30-C6]|uniref:RDD family protein n=1 Tax=Anaerotignum sp. MB30-C6 TaxID=3070814 RepID=UPI0027DE5F9C|nr:RDD family protein [Anaerotignum sp. MB30-C6]WMI82219.1 RDD family protein [Anaerotignum sp. MB30-C6]